MLALPFAAVALALAVGWDWLFFFMYFLVIDAPFRLWGALGVPVGRRSDYYGWANPNALGYALVALTDLGIWYAVASLAAVVSRRIWRLPY